MSDWYKLENTKLDDKDPYGLLGQLTQSDSEALMPQFPDLLSCLEDNSYEDPCSVLNEKTHQSNSGHPDITLQKGKIVPNSDVKSLLREERCKVYGCGGEMRINRTAFICQICGCVEDTGEDIAIARTEGMGLKPIRRARPRIVGRGSGSYQREMDRNTICKYSSVQLKNITDEYKKRNINFEQAGHNPFPLHAINLAAEYYNQMQRHGIVKRSHTKQQIMAAVLHQACKEKGFIRSVEDVSTLMSLPRRGISRGEDILSGLAEDGIVDVNINLDTCRPEIETTFEKLNMIGDEYNIFKDAVEAIVRLASKNCIGHTSILGSKVVGATYIVLRRSSNKSMRRSMRQMAESLNIRKNTITRFTTELREYHRIFEEEYKKWGLISEKDSG